MIEDRMEEGLSEEEAVLSVGPVDAIVAQIIEEIPFSKIAKERIKPKRKLKAWETVLLALGSPIWLPLGIAAFTVICSLYASVWAVIISLWAVLVSLICCALVSMAVGIIYGCSTDIFAGIAVLGAGMICLGLSVFVFYGCKAVSKGVLVLSRKTAICIKNCFIHKEEA